MNDSAATPEYDGDCAFGWSLGRQAVGKEKLQMAEGDKLYYFSNPLVKVMWKILPNRAAKADAAFAAR
jgi:hypothetical protein